MTFSTRLLIIFVFLLSLASTAVAHHKPHHSGGPNHKHTAPEIDVGSAAGAVGLLAGVGALLAERLRSK
jgi:hypothetical protein